MRLAKSFSANFNCSFSASVNATSAPFPSFPFIFWLSHERLFPKYFVETFAQDHPREGFWKCYYRLRNDGYKVHHKRLHRVYKQIGLPHRRKTKKRLPQRVKETIEIPESFTHTWSIDFMSDSLTNGRKF